MGQLQQQRLDKVGTIPYSVQGRDIRYGMTNIQSRKGNPISAGKIVGPDLFDLIDSSN